MLSILPIIKYVGIVIYVWAFMYIFMMICFAIFRLSKKPHDFCTHVVAALSCSAPATVVQHLFYSLNILQLADVDH
jgi:hypothetical protein